MKLSIAVAVLLICPLVARAESLDGTIPPEVESFGPKVSPGFFAWEKPTSNELIVLGAGEVLIVADVASTLRILKQGGGEGNPLLGTHPSPGKLLAFGGLGMISHAALFYLLPPKLRVFEVSIVFGVETAMVTRNVSAIMRF